jgi:3-oxoacyl-(acyl-carrier-protein) synthase
MYITDSGSITTSEVSLFNDKNYPQYVNEIPSFLKRTSTGKVLKTQNMINELLTKYPQLRSIGDGKKTGLLIGAGAVEWAGSSHLITHCTPDYTTQIPHMGLVNISGGQVAYKMKIKDYISVDGTACVSSLKCIEDAKYLMNAGVVDKVVVLGWDNQVNAAVREVFRSLGASISTEDYDNGVRPSAFDKSGGFLIGDGIGFIVLEKESDNPIAEVLGVSTQLYGLSNPLSIFKEGYIKSMTTALDQSGNIPIHVIKSHGTGTNLNNIAESEAINEVCGSDNIVTSYKPIIGHTMGASGAIELDMLLNDFKRGSLTAIYNKVTDCNQYINKDTKIVGNNFLVNAAGMGGVYTTLVGKWL